jgi:ATP-dependent DNA helicase RecQ
VPPYVIFPDTTLIALAKERPASSSDLLGVPGIGATKRERYGDAFLDVIRNDG